MILQQIIIATKMSYCDIELPLFIAAEFFQFKIEGLYFAP